MGIIQVGDPILRFIQTTGSILFNKYSLSQESLLASFHNEDVLSYKKLLRVLLELKLCIIHLCFHCTA